MNQLITVVVNAARTAVVIDVPLACSWALRDTSLDGCELELFGVTGRASQPVSSPGEVTFSLDRGLPEHAWLWLKNGIRWLDYRSIDPGSGWTGDLARAGVDIAVPSDPRANVAALLAAGEGPQLEYKRHPPPTRGRSGDVQDRRGVATGDGGIMVFGIDPDELTVTGLDGEDPKKLRDRLYDLVHRTVVPSPDVTVEDHQVDGKTILVLHVAPGPAPHTGSPRTKAPGTSPSSTCAGAQVPTLPSPANYAKQPAPARRST